MSMRNCRVSMRNSQGVGASASGATKVGETYRAAATMRGGQEFVKRALTARINCRLEVVSGQVCINCTPVCGTIFYYGKHLSV